MSITAKRVLLLGIDGADPRLILQGVEQGYLPNLAHLIANGTFGPIEPPYPPISPVAWLTALSGVSPARHGVHDFVAKKPGHYQPTLGLYEVEGSSGPISHYRPRVHVPLLHDRLAEHGRRALLIKFPGTFPPPSPTGNLLAGFGVPDLAGTFGVSARYTTHWEEERDMWPEGRDWIQPLEPDKVGTWRGIIQGPPGANLPFRVHRADGTVALSSFDEQVRWAILRPGDWSGWVRLSFFLLRYGEISGMCRFKWIPTPPDRLVLYRTPVICPPDTPLYPLSTPPGWAGDLGHKVGPYSTLGSAADLDGVRRGIVDLDTFLEEVYANSQKVAAMANRLAADGRWDLLAVHIFLIDSVQHVLWHAHDPDHPAYTPELAERYGKAIWQAYRWIDRTIGELVEQVGEETLMVLVSDHGVAPVYRLIYPNTWLALQKKLTPASDEPGAQPIEWHKTKAAMFGTGRIWLNVAGREPWGNVDLAGEYDALRRQLTDELLSWHDPETGEQIIEAVYPAENVYPEEQVMNEGPDLLLALRPGYGLGRGEATGRVMQGTSPVLLNHTRWTAGHEGPYQPARVPGIALLHGAGIPKGHRLVGARLLDLTPTVLEALGLSQPVDVEGTPMREMILP